MSQKAVKSQALFFAAELALFFLFLALNFKTPLMGEDYALLSFYPIENIHFGMELFSKMGARILLQINGWNVRVGEQLSIFWGCFDKHYFDFFNSLMFLYFLFLIRIYAFKNKYRTREALISLLTSVVLLFLFQPAFGEIFFLENRKYQLFMGHLPSVDICASSSFLHRRRVHRHYWKFQSQAASFYFFGVLCWHHKRKYSGDILVIVSICYIYFFRAKKETSALDLLHLPIVHSRSCVYARGTQHSHSNGIL